MKKNDDTKEDIALAVLLALPMTGTSEQLKLQNEALRVLTTYLADGDK